MRIDCDFDPLPQPALVPQNTEHSSFEKNDVPVVLWGSDAHSGRMYYVRIIVMPMTRVRMCLPHADSGQCLPLSPEGTDSSYSDARRTRMTSTHGQACIIVPFRAFPKSNTRSPHARTHPNGPSRYVHTFVPGRLARLTVQYSVFTVPPPWHARLAPLIRASGISFSSRVPPRSGCCRLIPGPSVLDLGLGHTSHIPAPPPGVWDHKARAAALVRRPSTAAHQGYLSSTAPARCLHSGVDCASRTCLSRCLYEYQ